MRSVKISPHIIKAALLTLMICLLCGCAISFSVDNMISPPKLSEEQTEIYNALTMSVGNVNLRYPRTGDYRSAFVIKDIDGTGSNEAIVFFEPQASVSDGVTGTINNTGIRVCFLEKDDAGDWQASYELAADGTAVESIGFSALGGDKELILISYSLLNSSDKVMSVIDYSDGVATVLARITYSFMRVCEFTQSGSDDLLCFSRDSASGTTVFCDYRYADGRVTRMSNPVYLSSEITDCDRLTMGKCLYYNNELPCMALDYMISDTLCSTSLIFFNGKYFSTGDNFVKQPADLSYYRRLNGFTPKVFSRDVNDDGIIEIPVTAALPGYESLTYPEQLNIYTWYSQIAAGVEPVSRTFIEPAGKYSLEFPGRWMGLVTAKISANDPNEIMFYCMENEDDGYSSALLAIKVIYLSSPTAAADEADALSSAYTLFYKDSVKKIFVRNIEYQGLSLTSSELTAALKITEE